MKYFHLTVYEWAYTHYAKTKGEAFKESERGPTNADDTPSVQIHIVIYACLLEM